MEEKFLKIFNRNIPIKNEYTTDEIKKAFLKESYSSGTKREQKLYIRFFTECTNNDDLQELIKFCKTSSTKIKKLYLSFEQEKKIAFGTFWSTRFRIEKVIGKIVSRKDKIYTEIDNFESYELTPCIAYEMAIRNREVKKLLVRHNKISEMLENENYFLFPPTKGVFAFIHNIDNEQEQEEKYQKAYTEYKEKEKNYSILIKENYKLFIDNYIDKCTALSLSELMELKQKLEDELINYYLIYPKGYLRQIYGGDSTEMEEVTNSKKRPMKKILDDDNIQDNGINIRYEKIIHNEFIQYQGVYKNLEKYYINNVLPNFSRQVNDQDQISVAINFSLPENEILEYIRRIKKKISPKTHFELLGNKLEKANDSSSMNTFDSNNREVTFDATKGESPQSKIADMFFIYDMKIKGFTNFDIIYELKKTYTEKTIKKYFVIAKAYIDNLKYKELITGKVEKKW